MTYLFEKYPQQISLDVTTDNEKAALFYNKCGLELFEKYISESISIIIHFRIRKGNNIEIQNSELIR
jgi:ribosomal protein S18 acetylase RimI-like enzyme